MRNVNVNIEPRVTPLVDVQPGKKVSAVRASEKKPGKAPAKEPKREEPKKKAEGKTSPPGRANFFSRGSKVKDRKKGKR